MSFLLKVGHDFTLPLALKSLC